MLVHLQSVLDAHAAREIARSLQNAEFVDGRLTSGDPATRGKVNLQLPRGSAHSDAAGEAVLRALVADPLFVRAVQPRTVIRPQFARYDVGMQYARHIDSPFMLDRQRIRTDVSVTIFLNDESEYEGGDLVVITEAGARSLRGNAGDAVIYPSTYVHEVTQITRGSRLVAVTWAQSLVRNAAQRKILFDLATATDVLASQGGEDAARNDALTLLRQSHDNLLRSWADP